MSVTYPRGFVASGVTAGCKPSGLADLGMLVGEAGTSIAALFTTNQVAAAPVVVGRARVAQGSLRAVVVNSGQANAATGDRGIADATTVCELAGELLGIGPAAVLPCSTGMIGEPLHMERLTPALPAAVQTLSRDGGQAFARAIMTTDTVDKQARADGIGFRVGGCAKGVGMVAPHLATMLAFLTTDADVGTADLQRLAAEVVRPRFTALSVDASASTNDTVLLLSSGAASGGPPVVPGSQGWTSLAESVGSVADDLVRQLIADGEGAEHVVVVDVGGAANDADARSVARAVVDSPLVKTAAFGGDPNPGRILQAAGAAGVVFDPAALDVSIGGVVLAQAGVIPAAYFEPASALAEDARQQMKDAEISITVSIGAGPGRARMFGCDLSYEYVRINGEYTT